MLRILLLSEAIYEQIQAQGEELSFLLLHKLKRDALILKHQSGLGSLLRCLSQLSTLGCILNIPRSDLATALNTA